MSEQNDHSGKQSYDAGELRRYLAGGMTAAEMHALEQATLEDPMLSDALDGMRTARSDTRAGMAILRQRLAARNSEKVPSLPFWRSWPRMVAAAVVLLGLSGLGYFFVLKSASQKTIAQSNLKTAPVSGPDSAALEGRHDTVATSTANTDSFASTGVPKADADYARKEKAESTPGSSRIAVARAKRAKTANPVPATVVGADATLPDQDDRRDSAPESEKSKEGIVREEEIVSARTGDPKTRPAMMQDKVAAVQPNPEKTASVAGKPFSGQVFDEKGNALAGVMVRIGKSGTVTDSQGKFAINAPADSNLIDFSSVGYQPQTLFTYGPAGNDLSVKLKTASASLGEVVVTGYGSARKKSASAATAPAPAPGWSRYRNYLGANKTQSNIDSSLHGTERLSFSITRNGEPVDFSVDESLSPEHDSLAVRIIRNGPKWKPAKDTTHRVSLALPY